MKVDVEWTRGRIGCGILYVPIEAAAAAAAAAAAHNS
jgi:hypothetical protein